MDTENQPDPTEAKAAMLELMQRKQSPASQRHDNVPEFNADPALSDFFADEDYDQVFNFLETTNSTRSNHQGEPLVIPGNPDDSAFYKQIALDGGVMRGRFSDEEIQVVRNWIVSLAPADPPSESAC